MFFCFLFFFFFLSPDGLEVAFGFYLRVAHSLGQMACSKMCGSMICYHQGNQCVHTMPYCTEECGEHREARHYLALTVLQSQEPEILRRQPEHFVTSFFVARWDEFSSFIFTVLSGLLLASRGGHPAVWCPGGSGWMPVPTP